MVDPIAPTADDIKRLQDYDAAAKQAGVSAPEALGKIKDAATSMATGAALSFTHLQTYLKNVGNTLEGTGKSADTAKLAFMALSTATVNARASFEGLAGVDYGNINTLHGQMDELQKSLGAGGEKATAAGRAISSMFERVAKNKMPDDTFKAMQVIPGAMVDFMKNLATKADNMTKLQAGLIAVSAQTGNLGNVYEKAGVGLKNINSVLADHTAAMSATKTATGATGAAVESYYIALGSVPKALESVVSSGTSAGGNMNMLTAVMKMAAGNGREVRDVIKDMGDVFKSLNMTGAPALAFINRFSELSNNLGVELNDMKGGLMGVVDSFKNLFTAGKDQATMTEGITNLMNKYVSALKEAGMTGKHATETVVGMADSMSKLTMAQKVFISGQTGGAGDIGGALSIEKMLRDHDVEGLNKKALEAIKKQTGPIISFEQAQREGGATAEKFQMQRQMVSQQGPLGAISGAKNVEDAGRYLDALYAIEHGLSAPKVSKGEEGLQDAISKGTSIQERNKTEFSEMNDHLYEINSSTSVMAKAFTERNFGIAVGTGTEGLSKNQQRRQDQMTVAAKRGGAQAEDLGIQMGDKGAMKDTAGRYANQAVKGVTDWFSHIPDVINSVLDPVKKALTSGDKAGVERETSTIKRQIAEAKERIKTETGEALAKDQESIKNKEAALKSLQSFGAAQNLSKMNGQLDKTTGKVQKPQEKQLAEFERPYLGPGENFGKLPSEMMTRGKQVAAAPRGTTAAAPGSKSPGSASASTPQVNVTHEGDSQQVTIDVNVKVNGKNAQAASMHPTNG